MPRPKGSPRVPGSGRQKGTRNKDTVTRENEQKQLTTDLREILKEESFDPLREVIRLFRKTDKDNLKYRIIATLLPYLYPTLKSISLETNATIQYPVIFESLLEEIEDDTAEINKPEDISLGEYLN